MTKTRMMLAAVAAGALAAKADTLAFWDFRERQPGESVYTVTSSAGTSTYVSEVAQTTHATNGKLPLYSEDSPGSIFADGALICEKPQSLDMRYPSRDQRHGGYLDIPGVADDLSSKTQYTLEFFLKLDPDFNYQGADYYDFVSKTAIYVASQSCGYKFRAPIANEGPRAKNLGIEVYKSATGSVSGSGTANSCIASDGNWHHLAVVYTETNSVSCTGKLAFWADYKKIQELPYENIPGQNLKFRLGTGYRDANGADKTATETMNGWISALRVSDVALASGSFLVAADLIPDVTGLETAAFYAFADGEPGEEAHVVTNSVREELMIGNVAITHNGSSQFGERPRFSSEIPAKRVYSDATLRTVLSDNYKSIYFRPVYGTAGGGKIDFADASAVAHNLDSFTWEFFFKIPEEQTENYRTPFGFAIGPKTDVKLNLSSYNSTYGYNVLSCEVRTNLSNTAGFNGSNLCSCAKYSARLGNGWHHFALVYDKAATRADLYLDREMMGTVHYTNDLGAVSTPFRLGSSAATIKEVQEAFGGYLACPRLTTRALGPDGFMVATDAPRELVFSVNFNEGQGKHGQKIGTHPGYGDYPFPINANVAFATHTEPMKFVYGLHQEIYPEFDESSRVRAGRNVRWGDDLQGRNLAGCRFFGKNSLPADTPNRDYAGTELIVSGSESAYRNPENWTMEAFVRAEYQQYNSLIFGKAGQANNHKIRFPECAWLLLLEWKGNLRLRWTEKAEDPDYVYSENSTEYYKEALTAAPVITKDRWHHVALSFEKATRTFKLYVDYKLVLETTATREVLETPHPYHFSRISISSGFEGWMDEIRFSNVVREPADFVRMDQKGLAITIR